MRKILDWFERVPAFVKISFAIAGFLMSAFSSRLPDSLQDLGLWSGLTVGGIAVIGLALHAIRESRKGKRVTAVDLTILGLGGLIVFAAITLIGVIWQINSPARA